MKAYDYRNGAHRMPALEADEGPYRLRRSSDAAWPPKERAYGGQVQTAWTLCKGPLQIAARLVLPVLLLSTLLGAAFLYTDDILTFPGAPNILNTGFIAMSDLILPIAFFSIHLTNRRYGAGYAFAQLVAGIVILGLVALVNPGDVDDWITSNPALSWRAMMAFEAAFLFANFIAIVSFDAARGPRWWSAPLASSCAAAFCYSAVYYPAAFAGSDSVMWTQSALVHFCVFLAESLLLLVPYCLLRPAMRPLAGMNGY